MQLDDAIREEIAQAAVGLGASVAEARQIASGPRSHIHRALSDLGAAPLLLALMNSWRDANDELGVLNSLREWNGNGDFKFFRLPPRKGVSG
ncbi:MAG: hypothetical protein ACJ8G5_18575 [Burkholderiales bacterium]